MSGTEAVIFAFRHFRKAGKTPALSQTGKALPSAGYQLVRVALMPDVEYKMVGREAENPVKRKRKLHRAEIRCKMPACHRNIRNKEIPYLLRKKIRLLRGQVLHVRGTVYPVKYDVSVH